jgi:hypothetical protein
MVFLSNMRKIEVSNAVITVETHEKFSIADGYVSWHAVDLCFASSGIPGEERGVIIKSQASNSHLRSWLNSSVSYPVKNACDSDIA